MCSNATAAAIARETPATDRPPTTVTSHTISRTSVDILFNIINALHLDAITHCKLSWIWGGRR